MTKSSAAEQARRVNLTLSLIRQRTSTPEVLQQLVRRYGLSRRQAYRYLRQAQLSDRPVLVPEPKAVFTVKLPRSVILQLRRQARRRGCSISLWVEQALRVRLDDAQGHG